MGAIAIPQPQVVQRQRFLVTGSPNIGSASTPEDNSIPQITEGNSVFSESFTPRYDNSLVRIIFRVPTLSTSAAGVHHIVGHLHIDGQADAVVVANALQNGADNGQPGPTLFYEFQPGSVATFAIDVRLGINAAGSIHLNVRTTAGGIDQGNLGVTEMLVEELL